MLENKNQIIKPLISVLYPVYNAINYLEDSIESLLNQTYTNFEIVAIEDGSSDDSYSLLLKYQIKDSRIKIFKNEANIGLIDSLNKGLNYCTGKYVARMDSDDIIRKDRFQKQVDFLEKNPDFDAVSSCMEVFDENGNKHIVKYRQNIEEIKSTILFYSPVSHAASMFKANVIKELGYRKEYKFAEDYDLWFRFLQKYKVGVIPETLYFYRTHSNQSTSPKNNEIAFYTHQLISKNTLNFFNIVTSNDCVDFHVNYCLYGKNIETKDIFIKWDLHLRQFLNKNTQLLNDESFISFVFKNYWQTNFRERLHELSVFEINKILASPFCLFSPFNKFKIILKKLIF